MCEHTTSTPQLLYIQCVSRVLWWQSTRLPHCFSLDNTSWDSLFPRVSHVFSRAGGGAAGREDSRNNQLPWWAQDIGGPIMANSAYFSWDLALPNVNNSVSQQCYQTPFPKTFSSPKKRCKKIIVPEARFFHPAESTLRFVWSEVSNLLCIWKEIASILKMPVLSNSACIQNVTTKNKQTQ